MIIKNGDYNFIPCDNNGNGAEVIPNGANVLNRCSEEEIFDLIYKGIFFRFLWKRWIKSWICGISSKWKKKTWYLTIKAP